MMRHWPRPNRSAEVRQRSKGTGYAIARYAIAGLFALAAFAPPARAQPQIAVLEHDGVRYGSVVFERYVESSQAHTRETARLGISALNAREWRSYEQRSSESSDGRPLSLSRRSQSGPATLQASARIVGSEIRIERREGAQARRAVLPVPADLLVDAGLVRRIAAQPADTAWAFVYSEIDLSAARVVRVRLSSAGRHDGERLELLRETGDGDETVRRRLYWSTTQQRLLPSWDLAGARFDSHACGQDCDDARTRYYDLMAGLTLASPYRIPAASRRKTLRYVFESADGIAPELPATGEQSVRQRGARSVVTVCNGCGDEAAPDAGTVARYRDANAWVQSDHPTLRALARSARANGSIDGRMHRLVRFVQKHMDGGRQSLGYASALQAATTRSGDCTEFAVLLAALARASHIPARVVGGLVYSSHFTGKGNVFSPHAWVQVWNGSRWVSFDAGMGEFDSTHIVLAIGDGSVDDYAGLLARVRALRLVDAGQIAATAP